VDALDAIHSRVSVPRLVGPEPTVKELDAIFKAALRAADHGMLRPWRFLVVRGQARNALGELFVSAVLQDDPDTSPALIDKTRSKPLRAPLIVVAMASIRDHEKIPEMEQIISAGAAVQNMMLAAHAQNLGAMWRTGSLSYHPVVEKGLGLSDKEKIVGFLYLGQKEGRSRLLPNEKVDLYFQEWEG